VFSCSALFLAFVDYQVLVDTSSQHLQMAGRLVINGKGMASINLGVTVIVKPSQRRLLDKSSD